VQIFARVLEENEKKGKLGGTLGVTRASGKRWERRR